MEFQGSLGKYKIISTEDNTETVWSEYFDENCHNLSGAYEETLYNYIHGCAILQKLKDHSPLNVFDVGFGVGLGAIALYRETRHLQTPIHYYSIEIDHDFLKWTLKEKFKDVVFCFHERDQFYRATWGHLTLTILVGDAVETIPRYHEKFKINFLHAIFQDAFSPRKNPGLWTLEWFTLLKKLSHQSVTLSTYSSSAGIRKTLEDAGFIIENHPGFGKKRFMTKAFMP